MHHSAFSIRNNTSRHSLAIRLRSNFAHLTLVAASLCLLGLAATPSWSQAQQNQADCQQISLKHPEKLGVGVNGHGSIQNSSALMKIGVKSYYDWAPYPDLEKDGGEDFTPMIWGKANVNSNALKSVKKSAYSTLLGFNEPDNAEQSSMSVDQAISLWPRLEATGKRLGSPASAGDATQGWQWSFMQEVKKKGLRVDFMAIHFYQAKPDVNAFREHLIKVHKTYGLPIWVTEYSLANWSNVGQNTLEEQAAYQYAAAKMMDDLDFVERYYWFALWAYDVPGYREWKTSLFDKNGQLTSVGDATLNLLKAAQAANGNPVCSAD